MEADIHNLAELKSNLSSADRLSAFTTKTIYEAGLQSVAQIAHAKASELLERMNAADANKQYYKANLGEKDMQFIIDAANIVLETEVYHEF